jgi:ABC-type branched-subunit amino acid transport system substrate-binding protein
MRHIILTRAALIALLLSPLGFSLQAAEPVTIGIAEVDYIDTSGELKDQQAAHADRAKRFAEALRADLAASGQYKIVTLDCGKDPCSAENQIPEDLIAAAKQAGARVLVYGGVHKMSTLVQNMKAQAVDLESDRLVFERLITFRGDDNASWERAERFLAQELLEQPLTK